MARVLTVRIREGKRGVSACFDEIDFTARGKTLSEALFALAEKVEEGESCDDEGGEIPALYGE